MMQSFLTWLGNSKIGQSHVVHRKIIKKYILAYIIISSPKLLESYESPMTQRLPCYPSELLMSACSTAGVDRNWKCLFLLDAVKHYIFLCCSSSRLIPDLFFSSWCDRRLRVMPQRLLWWNSSGLKCIANLRALPELFNCGIYRSEGESFIYLSALLPCFSLSLCFSLCFSVYFENL